MNNSGVGIQLDAAAGSVESIGSVWDAPGLAALALPTSLAGDIDGDCRSFQGATVGADEPTPP